MNGQFLKRWFRKKEEKQLNKSEESSTTETKHHAEIGKVAAFFAHEIRNPLTTIIGFSKHLEQEPTVSTDPMVSNYISIIKDEALRMEVLIQELLSLSKLHLVDENLSIIDVKQTIEKILTINMLRDINNIKFKTYLIDDVYITGNINRFERLLINLIKNSIEAMGQNGEIKIHMSKENKQLFLSIIDNGPGIPDDKLEKIFCPFYTTKDNGTGIGLPICKTIIETLNGTMMIENESPKGVHVKLTIPLSQQSIHNG